MSGPNAIGNGPAWNYGKNASFGLWVNALKGARMFVALYKGVVFTSKTTVLWKATATNVDVAEGEDPLPPEIELEFKQKIEPTLTVVPPCGAVIPHSEFPIVIFVSGTSVVYCGDDLKSFKKFASVSEGAFYELSSGGVASAFELPEPDATVYDDAEATVDDTKKGLLIPLWRISVEKGSSAVLRISEVLDIRTRDTFAFEEAEAEPDAGTDDDPDGGTGDNICEEDDGEDDEGLDGGVGEDPGIEDPTGENGLAPCPVESTNND